MNQTTEPAQPIDNVALASVYRLHACNFRISAETLCLTMELQGDGRPAKLTAIPFYFLVSHAAELLLKCALLKRDVTDDDLKAHGLRHNLGALLKVLQDRGCRVSDDTMHLIAGLSPQHQSHELRYTVLADNGKTTFWPPPSLLFTMLDELLSLTAASDFEIRAPS